MTTTERDTVQDFEDFRGHVLDRDPFVAFLEYREREPFWVDDGREKFWVITRYEQVREVQQDYRTFAHGLTSNYGMPPEHPLMPSDFDPPYQTKLRSVVLPHMSSAKMGTLEPKMHQVCRDLIDSLKGRGSCDLQPEFAQVYPITMFSDFFGLPADRREEFRRLADTWSHDFSQKPAMWAAIRAVVREQMEERLDSPRDDMLSGVVHGEIDGERIDIDVAVNLASTVFLGGLDSVPATIGWVWRYLADHPDVRRRIVEDPACIPNAVEEFLRVFPAVARNGGVATRDVDFHGAAIKAGDRVRNYISLANQDSAVFDDPLTLNFDRPANKHIAFSAGSHRCLGSHLVRHELAVALQEWHAQIPDYRVAEPDKIIFIGGGVLSIDALPLEWDV